MSMRPLFNLASVRAHLEGRKDDYEDKVIEALQRTGEQFVNKARNIRTYQDRTGALRASIGYILLKDGREVNSNFQGNNPTGIRTARGVAQKVAGRYRKGVVLIGVAGMEYAAAVEAKNYDVITSSTPNAGELRNLLNAIKF